MFLDDLVKAFKSIDTDDLIKLRRESTDSKKEIKAAVGCYKADINCENCHELLEFELPKGVTVISYCEKLICPNCGCPIYESYEEEE
jgi:hypothetical protein